MPAVHFDVLDFTSRGLIVSPCPILVVILQDDASGSCRTARGARRANLLRRWILQDHPGEIRNGTVSILYCQPFKIEKDKGEPSMRECQFTGRLNVTRGWKRAILNAAPSAIELEQHRNFLRSGLNASHPLYNPGKLGLFGPEPSSVDAPG